MGKDLFLLQLQTVVGGRTVRLDDDLYHRLLTNAAGSSNGLSLLAIAGNEQFARQFNHRLAATSSAPIRRLDFRRHADSIVGAPEAARLPLFLAEPVVAGHVIHCPVTAVAAAAATTSKS